MSSDEKVKAVCYGRYGGRDRLRLGTVVIGSPGDDEVTVRVAAVALNPIDWKLREGQARWVHPLRFPVVPGFDFCAWIEACGSGVKGFRPGDRVCGMSDRRSGATLAEKCICSASVLARAPGEMPDEEAAGLPLAGLTALQGLRRHGLFARGMRVLVVGASGGVGHLTVQLASHWGGRVTAVCGPENVGWVRGLGPEQVIDYHRAGWLREAESFDLIFDAVGAVGFGRGGRHLRRGGSYVTTVPGPGIFFDQFLRAPLVRRRARVFLVRPSGAELNELIDAWEGGHLRVRVDHIFDLDDFKEAFTYLETGHARGKVVVRIAP